MLKKVPKKAWIGIGIGVVAIVIAVVLIVVINSGEESYRQIKVYDIEGTASVERGADNIIEAYVNMHLKSQDIVNTSTDSYLQLKLDDDKYILLEPLTRIRLEAEGNTIDSKTKIYLEEGAIVECVENRLSENSEYQINTPNSTMAIRGTTFRIAVTYDEKGESYTKLSVYEGKVSCNLVFPDGSVDTEAVMVTDEKQVNILGTEKTSQYVGEEEQVVYEELETKVLEFLKIVIDKGEELHITKEEINEIIRSRGEIPDEEKISGDGQEESQEGSVGDSTGDSTGVSTEEITTKGTTVEGNESNNNEQGYTVTFTYNGKVFATQKVESGNTAVEPKFKPTASGSWNHDFETEITEDTTIEWKEQ